MRFNHVKSIITMEESPLVQRAFKEIAGKLCVTHMTIAVVLPKGDLHFLSTSSEFVRVYNETKLLHIDKIWSPIMYENCQLYPNDASPNQPRKQEIKRLKTKDFDLHNGTVLVRKIDNYHIIYGIATNKKSPMMRALFLNRINDLLRMGDYMYNETIDVFEKYGEIEATLPKIEIFKPFLVENIELMDDHERDQAVHNYEAALLKKLEMLRKIDIIEGDNRMSGVRQKKPNLTLVDVS